MYLAPCRCLPRPDGFALLASSIHLVPCCLISAHQRRSASNKLWRLSSLSLSLHPRGLLLIRYSSSDLYRSPPSWAITFSESLFITFDLSSGCRCYYQVRFSDCSAQSSYRDSSEGPHVCGYNDGLLFVFLFCTFIGNFFFVICHLCTLTKCESGTYGPVLLAIQFCFLANRSVSTEDKNNSWKNIDWPSRSLRKVRTQKGLLSTSCVATTDGKIK